MPNIVGLKIKLNGDFAEMTILYDSGIRTGADVFKAIALGAHAVMVGRLFVWGMSHEGEYGCRHVMKSLLAVSKDPGFVYFPCAEDWREIGFGYLDDRRRVPFNYKGRVPEPGRLEVQSARHSARSGRACEDVGSCMIKCTEPTAESVESCVISKFLTFVV